MNKKAETTTFNNDLFERMQDMNRSWLERLREIRQIEADFGARLLTAKSPSEATTICNEWMAKRLETVASEQQTFTTAWLELVWDATKSTSAMSTEASGQNMQKIDAGISEGVFSDTSFSARRGALAGRQES